MTEDVRDAFWKELNIVYFLRHFAPGHRLAHGGTRRMLPLARPPSSSAVRAARGNVCKVLVYTHDQKDLFARVVAFFEREGLSILDARIHTTVHGWALDTFLVQDKRGRDLKALGASIEKNLANVISSAKPLPEPKKGKLSRRGRSFPVTPIVEIEARRESAQLGAAHHLQRPYRPFVCHRRRVGTARHQPCHRQDLHAR